MKMKTEGNQPKPVPVPKTAGYPETGAKTSGVKTRGNGAATAGSGAAAAA